MAKQARQIWKFTFDIADRVRIPMPPGAKPISVQMQNGEPCMWAEVEPCAQTVDRDFFIYGTGDVMPDNPGKHIGTFQMLNGKLVWHMYEQHLKAG